MYTVASLLDIESDKKVQNVWSVLEDNCSLKGIRSTPLPHISWQASEDFLFEDLERYLIEFTSHHKPFSIRTTGLGIFTGEKIILYLAVVQSTHLAKMHNLMWKGMSQFGRRHYYYSPD